MIPLTIFWEIWRRRNKILFGEYMGFDGKIMDRIMRWYSIGIIQDNDPKKRSKRGLVLGLNTQLVSLMVRLKGVFVGVGFGS